MQPAPVDIVYLHQHYRHPDEGGAVRSHYIADGLAKAGLKVVVLAGRSVHHLNHVLPQEGYQVIGISTGYTGKKGVLGRLIAFVWYVIWATFYLLKYRPKLVFATSTPLTVVLPPLILSSKFVLELRDLWPQAPEQLGFLNLPILKNLAYLLANHAYSKAESIIVLSQVTADYLAPYNHKIITASNFASPITHDELVSKLATRHKAKTLYYGGSVGKANDPARITEIFSWAIEAGWHVCLAANPDHHLPNISRLNGVEILGYLNQEEELKQLDCATIALVSFAHLPALKANSPNKLFKALALGIPVCFNWQAPLAVQVQSAGGGHITTEKDTFLNWLKALEDEAQYHGVATSALHCARPFNQTEQVKLVMDELCKHL